MKRVSVPFMNTVKRAKVDAEAMLDNLSDRADVSGITRGIRKRAAMMPSSYMESGRMKKPLDFMQRLPGMKQNLKKRILQVGTPIYKAARTGVNFVNKIDDKLDELSDANIPVLSGLIRGFQNLPMYDQFDKGAENAARKLDDGVGFLKGIDAFTDGVLGTKKPIDPKLAAQGQKAVRNYIAEMRAQTGQ